MDEADQEWVRIMAERQRIDEIMEAMRAYDRRPLRGSRFQDCCRQTRDGGGLPEGGCIPPGITHDLVLQFDVPARRMEREERLLAMHGGDRVDRTLDAICEVGGVNDVRFLLAHGADVNYWGNYGPVLAVAAVHGHIDVVETLLDAGAAELDMALSEAAAQDYTAIVALLLDRGADIHAEADSALYNAVHGGSLEAVALLLARGATPDMPYMAEQATARGHHAIADLLRAHVAA